MVQIMDRQTARFFIQQHMQNLSIDHHELLHKLKKQFPNLIFFSVVFI